MVAMLVDRNNDIFVLWELLAIVMQTFVLSTNMAAMQNTYMLNDKTIILLNLAEYPLIFRVISEDNCSICVMSFVGEKITK